MSRSPFHEGEQAVQTRLGVRDSIEPWARKVIRGVLPRQHQDFYPQLPFLVAAARDGAGRPWATLLVGPPGFASSPDERSLWVGARPVPGDALESALITGADLGLLGIQLETRRRNRVNGRIIESSAAGIRLEVGQSFGNCPQYITVRAWHRASVHRNAAAAFRYDHLNDAMKAWIGSADTMFIASGYGDARARDPHDQVLGMDASHRGGPAGFVSVIEDRRLVFPDYAGNNHFNTLGNLAMDPRVGLLFVDFQRGSLLQITGSATIDWGSPEVADYAGAERLIYVDIESVVHLDAALPLRWRKPSDQVRLLRLARRIKESVDVTSFEFVADNGRALPPFEAGQHLAIELELPGLRNPIERTYSLSNGPGQGRYRISVKRHDHGVASRLLHDGLREGDLIQCGPPAGSFILDCTDRPTVLISAGVGVTPMVSMLHQRCPDQPVIFVHGARDGAHHPLAAEVRQLAADDGNVTIDVSYSRPRSEDVPGRDFHRQGRVTGRVIHELLPGLDGEFYLCGPTGFMADVFGDLVALGVGVERIHTESFGAADGTANRRRLPREGRSHEPI